jgi:hypothetical protein
MSKTTRARCTLEFKLEAVRLVRSGWSVAAMAATLDVSGPMLSAHAGLTFRQKSGDLLFHRAHLHGSGWPGLQWADQSHLARR